MSGAAQLGAYKYYSNADLSGYAGEWVAIINNSVVDHKKDVRELLKSVKEKYPTITPFIAKIPSKEIVIW